MPAALTDVLAAERASVLGKLTVDDILRLIPIVFPLGGQFLLDPNEFNGWGVIGPYDDTNSQDLGNVAADPNRSSGGICFPYDVELKRFFAWHLNSNNAALAWGWRMFMQEKTENSNVVTNTDLLNEVADNGGTGPRDYLATTTQITDVSFVSSVIPAGNLIVLGVEAPTAVTTNYYARIMGGYLELRRV